MTRTLPPELVAILRSVDTPTICNAIELVAGGRRSHGFTRGAVICADPLLPPMVGFARTAVIRSAEPSAEPPAALRERRLAYYRYMAEGGGPGIAVIEDRGEPKGLGAFWGEVNVALHKGLGLQGVITDGSIRDLGAIDGGFHLLAGSVSPSHAFVRVEAFDTPVTLFGLAIAPGDLIHADRHGAVLIEPGVERELPRAIDLVTRKEAPLLAAARAPGFGIDQLLTAWGQAEDVH